RSRGGSAGGEAHRRLARAGVGGTVRQGGNEQEGRGSRSAHGPAGQGQDLRDGETLGREQAVRWRRAGASRADRSCLLAGLAGGGYSAGGGGGAGGGLRE